MTIHDYTVECFIDQKQNGLFKLHRYVVIYEYVSVDTYELIYTNVYSYTVDYRSCIF